MYSLFFLDMSDAINKYFFMQVILKNEEKNLRD